MKKFLVLFFSIFICSIAHADTETINWYVDGTSYATTTCQTGGDIILPNTPYKYGYTFQGWADYTPIEYIESTGTQWIDTGFYIDSDTEIEVVGNFTSINNSYQLFGIDAYPKLTNVNQFGIDSNNRWFFHFGQQSSAAISLKADTNEHTFVIKKSNNEELFFIDNVSIASQPYVSFTTTDSYYIFNRLYTNSNAPCFCNFRLRNFKFIKSGAIQMDLIPVLDINNVPCMYDKVSKTFFYNQGTGNFIAGPVITQ